MLSLKQQGTNLLDCLASGLHVVVLVQAMDGALRTDGLAAGKAKVSKLLLRVVMAGILKALSDFAGRVRLAWKLC